MIKYGEINIIIGSQNAYDKCDKKGLKSKWICLNDYYDWDEIEEELIEQGFELDDDEELYIQDIEGFICDEIYIENMSPKELYNILYESDILDNTDIYDKAIIYCDKIGFNQWLDLIYSKGYKWHNCLTIHKNTSWRDLGYHLIHNVYQFDIPEELEPYIDYDAYGRKYENDIYYEWGNDIVERSEF